MFIRVFKINNNLETQLTSNFYNLNRDFSVEHQNEINT